MSITCPKCGTDISQDFGLVTCANCSTVLSIDVDGNVQSENISEEIPAEILPEPEPEMTQTWAAPKTAFQEIADFGNKESTNSPISYSILIEDIDIAERIQDVMQALSDPKFGWDMTFLSKKLKSGTMKLEDLNPAQAVMVVKKLRGIHVKVSWTQSLYS